MGFAVVRTWGYESCGWRLVCEWLRPWRACAAARETSQLPMHSLSEERQAPRIVSVLQATRNPFSAEPAAASRLCSMPHSSRAGRSAPKSQCGMRRKNAHGVASSLAWHVSVPWIRPTNRLAPVDSQRAECNAQIKATALARQRQRYLSLGHRCLARARIARWSTSPGRCRWRPYKTQKNALAAGSVPCVRRARR